MTNIAVKRNSQNYKLLLRFLNHRLAVAGALVLVIITFCALFAPLIAPQNPYDLTAIDISNSLIPPIWEEGGHAPFLLGTDVQGRDILSTMLYGTRISMFVGISTVLLSGFIGTTIGLLTGYLGGWVDMVMMRIGDSLLSFSTTLIAMLFLGLFNSGNIFLVIFAISFSGWVQYARTMRSSVLSVREEDYVTGARVIGASHMRVAFRHIVPNAISPLLVIIAIDFGVVIMLESTLSFLGIGVPITEPSLGMMIAQGKDYIYANMWYLILFPGAVLISIVISLNLLADWLRDEVDPRAKNRR
ncbi:MAG: ABC transporter permease [Methylocystaceae bacterium]|nr:ABC transporter permease [Methylocystaceae bacterium]